MARFAETRPTHKLLRVLREKPMHEKHAAKVHKPRTHEKQKTVKFFKKSDNNSFQNSDQNSTHKSNKLCLMYVIIPSLNNILCEPIEDKMFHIYLFSSPSLKCRVGLLRLKTNSFLYALPPPQCAMDHRIKKFCLFSFFGHP